MQEAIRTIFELCAVIFLIWGFCNEEKFVAFERKIYKMWKNSRKQKIYTDVQTY